MKRSDKATVPAAGGLYQWLDVVVFALLLAIVALVPTLFSSRTVESDYVKQVALACLVLAGAVIWLARTIAFNRFEFTSSALNLAVLCFWLAAGASVLLSSYRLSSSRALWRTSVLVLLYLLTANFVSTRRRLVGLVALACSIAILVCAYAFAQRMGYDPVPWSQRAGRRVFSSIGNANMLAGYLVIMIALGAGLVFGTRGLWLRALGAVSTVACGVALAMTQTKGAWLALLVAVGTVGVCALYCRLLAGIRWTRRRKLSLGLAVCVALVGAGVLLPPAVRHFRRTFEASARVRIVVWVGAWRMFRDHPAVGGGLGTFQVLFPRYRPAELEAAEATFNALHAHSEYLQTLAEQGIVGGAALLFLVGSVAAVGLRGLREAEGRADRWMLCVLLAAAAGTLTHGVVSVALRWVVCPTFFWLVLGLVVSARNIAAGGATRRQRSLPLEGWQQVVLTVLLFVLAGWVGSALILRPLRAQVDLRRGKQLVRLGMWDAAISSLQAAAAQDEIEFRAYYQLAHAYYEKGVYKKALETYRALQKYAPDFARIHYNLGVTCAALGKWDEAGDEFMQAVRLGAMPPAADLKPLLDRLKGTQEGEGKYVAVLQEVVKLNPEDKVSWNRLGIWYFRKNELDEAREHFERALEVDEEYVPALNNLAGVYYNRADFDKAIEICERILAVNPRATKPHVNIGRAYYLKGDRKKAVEHWQAALAIDPNEPEAKQCLTELGGRP